MVVVRLIVFNQELKIRRDSLALWKVGAERSGITVKESRKQKLEVSGAAKFTLRIWNLAR